jgi:ribokinase
MAGVLLWTMHAPDVMLVGSANMDLVVHVDRFPNPGETLRGDEFQSFPGGKGANQACAVGRLGGSAGLLAKLGVDGFGDALVNSLISAGVAEDWILRDPSAPTGVALITVGPSGENTIVVSPGTNDLITPDDVSAALGSTTFKVLLTQLEIPLPAVEAAAQHRKHALFILNPAPARELPDSLLQQVDFITPNETEAHMLTGIFPADDSSCRACTKALLSRGVKNVILTLGENGSFWANREDAMRFPSIQVSPVDTTGAGDAFNGALAHFLSMGESIPQAIRYANVTGALSTTKPGAQASMPSWEAVQKNS